LKFANFGFITMLRVLVSFQRTPSTKKVGEPLLYSIFSAQPSKFG